MIPDMKACLERAAEHAKDADNIMYHSPDRAAVQAQLAQAYATMALVLATLQARDSVLR